MSILPVTFDFNGACPSQSRRLRLGVVGGGRISHTQAMAARLTDRWEVVAGALSSDPARAKAAARIGTCPKSGVTPLSSRWPMLKPIAPMVLMR